MSGNGLHRIGSDGDGDYSPSDVFAIQFAMRLNKHATHEIYVVLKAMGRKRATPVTCVVF